MTTLQEEKKKKKKKKKKEEDKRRREFDTFLNFHIVTHTRMIFFFNY